MLNAPHGINAILDFYGDPAPYIRSDGTVSPIWEFRMVVVDLPKPLPLGWMPSHLARGVRVNRVIATAVEEVLEALVNEGVFGRLRTYDGGYAWRPKRTNGRNLSMHAFGGALDFNAETNQQGTKGDQDERLVRIFEGSGWTWGGRFGNGSCDPMHFQVGRGY